MGFLDGFLGGVVTQHQRLEDQAREDAQQSGAREQAVLSHLMTSDDPEIKSLAVSGMLNSTQPKKRKGGFAGWLGEMQNNPDMDRIRALVAHDQAVGHMIPPEAAHASGQMARMGDVASASALPMQAARTQAAPGTAAGAPETPGVVPDLGPVDSGQLPKTPEAGPAGPSAAMSGNSPTEIGSAPPSPVQGGPGAAGPGAPASTAAATPGGASPLALLGLPEAAAAQAKMAPPTSTPTPGAPPVSATKPGVTPAAAMGQPEQPIGAGPLSPRGDVFRSPETQARKTKVAQSQGDVEGITAGLKSAGFSDEEIKQELKLHYGRGTGAGMSPQAVKGEAPNAEGAFSPSYGVFNKVTKQFEDPEGKPIPGFRPQATGGAQHFGVAIEAATQRLFNKSYGMATPEERAAAQKEVENAAGRTTAARSAATNEAKLDAPIGAANALKYGVPANTTVRQLSERIPLSQQDQDKIRGISTLEGTVGNIEQLIPRVFPDNGPGIAGRIKTAFSLFSQSAGRQEDITQLNSEIASAMAGIVRLNGITQRLNVKELDLAQQQMINTSALHGDTLDSAQAKMEILKNLMERVKGTAGPVSQPAPGTTGAIGAPPPSAAAAQAAPAPGAAAPSGPGSQAVPGLKMVNGKLVKADGTPY